MQKSYLVCEIVSYFRNMIEYFLLSLQTKTERQMTVKKHDFIHDITDPAFNRKVRAQFARFMDEQYNLNIQAYYRKLRKERIEQWELQGLLACAEEFLTTGGETPGTFANGTKVVAETVADIYAWFSQCDKMKFYEFMNEKGLCRDTIKKHMDDEDWTRLNLKGWNKAWREFKEAEDQH